MWLSKKLSIYRTAEQEGAAADMGITTIGGTNASVETRGEQRNLEVFAPRGIIWQPQQGDTVLVIKGGIGCQEHCIVAAETVSKGPDTLTPGELYLFSDGASLYLRNDGSILITGDLYVEGKVQIKGNVDIFGTLRVNGEPYKPCNCV